MMYLKKLNLGNAHNFLHIYPKFLKIAILLCTSLCLMAAACKKTQNSIPTHDEKAIYFPHEFVMGADLSYTNQVEDYGGIYRDSGNVKDPFLICKQRGTNLIRVRLFHNPTWTTNLNSGKYYNDLNDVTKTIRRAKNAGMWVNLDLHYSDTWADPHKQELPAAWQGLTLPILKDSIYQYTLMVLNHLKSQNLTPEIIQIGNENNNGMCFPLGKIVNDNFQPFAELLKSGIKAVRDFSINSTIKPQIILHVAQLHDADWWANGVVNVGGVQDFDILGISHYYQWANINTMSAIGATIRNLKTKYGKKIMIVETAYSWTTQNADAYGNIMSDPTKTPQYPLSPDGQFRYLRDLTQEVITAGGSGIMYWEAGWITSSLRDLWGVGSSWDNNTLFDFQGNALQGFDFMTFKYKK